MIMLSVMESGFSAVRVVMGAARSIRPSKQRLSRILKPELRREILSMIGTFEGSVGSGMKIGRL